MINVEMMREIADRINPKTRPDGVARYDQNVYGRLRNKFKRLNPDILFNEVPECGTTACIAGHAFIVSRGLEAWQKYLEDEEYFELFPIATMALGLTIWQAKVLFRSALSPAQIEACFEIIVDWNGLPSAKQVAKLLHRIANKYEVEQSSALEMGGEA